MGKKKKTKDDDVSLMAALSSLDEVAARIPGSTEHDQGLVPPWTELVVEIKRTDDGSLKPAWPLNVHMPLRRHDGELIIEVLHNVLHTNPGMSVADGLWMDLDNVMDRLMVKPKKADKGLALGLTIALARLSNPFQPDEEAIKAIAIERWNIRHQV